VRECTRRPGTQPRRLAPHTLSQGCKCVLGVCSVGSLTTSIPVGSFVVPDDWFCPHDVRRVSTGYSAHFMPTLDEDMRAAIAAGVKAASLTPVVRPESWHPACSLAARRPGRPPAGLGDACA